MKYMIKDKSYRFLSFFDTETGIYMRTNILDKYNKDSGEDPFMASFPHLIDIGIMGECTHGLIGLCEKAGNECYQNGSSLRTPNMSLEDFRWIIEQCRGRTYQVALGGRGDPDQHEHFEELIEICRKNAVVPNFTTSGYGMTAKLANICKEYCGAVAVSWYRKDYTINAIRLLLEAGVKTNIHYVLSKKSLAEAIARLKNNDFPVGVNAVIFLLYKPVGLGKFDNVITDLDKQLRSFFKELNKEHSFHVGIDSCTVSGYINLSQHIVEESFDTCEAARYSCYIGPDMIMTPCSFDQDKKYSVRLRPTTIEDAWNDEAFGIFRNHMRYTCPNCLNRRLCMGGCPLMPEIVLCNHKE